MKGINLQEKEMDVTDPSVFDLSNTADKAKIDMKQKN